MVPGGRSAISTTARATSSTGIVGSARTDPSACTAPSAAPDAHRGRGVPDVDLAAGDPVRAAVELDLLGQPADRVLGGGVGDRARSRDVGRERAVVDDPAALRVLVRASPGTPRAGTGTCRSGSRRPRPASRPARPRRSRWRGAPRPALLTSRSTRPCRSTVTSNSRRTASSSVTSVGTTSKPPAPATPAAATSCSAASRRPASTTRQPAPASASATARPMPLPAPVTTATRSRRAPASVVPVAAGSSLDSSPSAAPRRPSWCCA